MKILRVALENINSLAGSWTVDFESPDFRSEAFVVSGPTGAGKTSLLDAVALALYGRTSRQDSFSKTSNLVMTEGTGLCRAETDFLGTDGLRYRAVWEQHRAGNRPAGALQPVTRELLSLSPSGAPLATLAAGNEKAGLEIERRAGLSYDQFVRAVVLQQGDFASFLSAKKDERADLLEKAVRDSRFSEAGRRVFAAFQRAADARKRAETILADRLSLAAPAPGAPQRRLSPDDVSKRLQAAVAGIDAARAAALDRLGQAAADSARLAADLDALRTERAWVDADSALRAEETALASRRAETASLLAAFAPSRPRYDRAALARSLEPARHRLDLARQARDGESARQTALCNRLQTAESDASSAADALQTARARRDAVAADCLARRNVLDQAAAVDRDLHAAASRLQAARQTADDASAKAQRAERDAEDSANAADRSEALLRAALAWPPGTPPPPDFADTPLFAALADAAAADQKILRARHAVADAASRHTTAKTRADAARAADPALLRLRQDETDLQKQLDALKWSLDLTSQRALLHEGDACPLCGAPYHPSAIPPDLPAVVASAAARLQAAQAARQAAETARQSALDAESAAAAALLSAQTTLDAVLARTERDKQNGPLALERAKAQTDADRADATQKRALALRARVEADAFQADCARLGADHDRLLASLQSLLGPLALPDARRQVDLAEKNAEKALADAETKRATAQAALLAAQNDLAASADRLAALSADADRENRAFLDRLAPAFADEADWASSRLPDPDYLDLQTTARSLETRQRDEALLADALSTRRAALLDTAPPVPPRPLDLLDRLLRETAAAQSAADVAQGAARSEADALAKQSDSVQTAHRDWLQARDLHETWSRLNEWFGGQNGNAFRVYAQGVTLGKLLAEANPPLLAMSSGRYELDWDPADSDLLPVAVDHWRANDRRPVSNLSGGETFLVSLSLALALGRLAGKDLPIDTLFLDEGFGTLDDEKLALALQTLSDLHGDGCTVGVISHVPAVKSQGFDLIEVVPRGDGTSVLSGPGVSGPPRPASPPRHRRR